MGDPDGSCVSRGLRTSRFGERLNDRCTDCMEDVFNFAAMLFRKFPEWKGMDNCFRHVGEELFGVWRFFFWQSIV